MSAKPNRLLWAWRRSPGHTTVHAFADGSHKTVCGLVSVEPGDRWRITYSQHTVRCSLCATKAHKWGFKIESMNIIIGRH